MDTENLNINKEILIVPDVHCREFWRNALSYPGEIVFLGDYLDPYQYEFDTNPDLNTPFNINDIIKHGIDNLKEIIEFAKYNTDRVHLLLGNHCCHYLSLTEDTCRMSYKYKEEIFNLFNNNKDLFNIAYKWNNTLFTHAGVCNGWLKQNNLDSINKDNVVDYLNNMLHSVEWQIPETHWCSIVNCIDSPLGNIGRSRGGDWPCGGPLWADIDDMCFGSAFRNELIQIIGHSQLEDTGSFVQNNNFYACDSRSCFIYDENTLKPYKNEN